MFRIMEDNSYFHYDQQAKSLVFYDVKDVTPMHHWGSAFCLYQRYSKAGHIPFHMLVSSSVGKQTQQLTAWKPSAMPRSSPRFGSVFNYFLSLLPLFVSRLSGSHLYSCLVMLPAHRVKSGSKFNFSHIPHTCCFFFFILVYSIFLFVLYDSCINS